MGGRVPERTEASPQIVGEAAVLAFVAEGDIRVDADGWRARLRREAVVNQFAAVEGGSAQRAQTVTSHAPC